VPRQSSENQRIRDDRRQQILRAASHVFARKGLAATTIADIAQAAGVSHGLAYHYFASKEEIFAQLIRRAMEGTEHLLLAARAREGTVTTRLRWLIEVMIEGASDSADDLLIVQQAAISEAVPPEIRELVLQRPPVMVHSLSQLIREGQSNGELISGDPEVLALLLLSCIEGIFSSMSLRFQPQTIQSIQSIEADTLLQLFMSR